MSKLKLSFAILLITMMVGCATNSSRYDTQQATSVDLKSSNYQVMKSGAVGTSRGFKILGISLANPSYVNAMNDLKEEAPMEGKSSAVTNVVQEESSTNFLLFSIPKVSISGDLIEFTDKPTSE